jgi:hypothetical protein
MYAAYMYLRGGDEICMEEGKKRANHTQVLPQGVRIITKRRHFHFCAPRRKGVDNTRDSNNPLNPPRRPLGAFHHQPPNPTRLQTPSRNTKPYQSRKAEYEDHAERPPELAESVLCIS